MKALIKDLEYVIKYLLRAINRKKIKSYHEMKLEFALKRVSEVLEECKNML